MTDQTEQDQLRAEAFLGAVDEDSDIVWFVSPRSMLKPRAPTNPKRFPPQSASPPEAALTDDP
jgi:hypothetical protein